MDGTRGSETQSNASRVEIGSPKLKKELMADTDFFGETKVMQKSTTYTWALNDFKTLIKMKNHLDTNSFTLYDESNITCFLSADFAEWMSVHVTFCSDIPASHSYEITVHVMTDEKLSCFHEVAFTRDIIKGQKVTFEKFMLLEKDEFDNFLVDGYLFVLCEISRMDSTFTSRDTVIEMTENQILDDMPNLWKEQLLTDITIAAGEKEFSAHKCILAARSPVFLAMFQSGMIEDQENKVVLDDTDPECLKKFLEFFYSDKVENIQKDTDKLLEIADKYDVKGLKLLCAQELCNKIDVDSSINILKWADTYDVRELKERVLTFIRSHLKDVLESSAYNDVIRENPSLIKEIFCYGLPTATKRQKI